MIDLINLTNFPVDKRFFLAVAKKVVKGENKELENLSIAFVNSSEIQELNKKYRNKDKPTDVLSFEKKQDFKEDFLEVVVCPELVMEKAGTLKLSNKDLAKTLVHGILHSFGYDHEKSKEEAEIMFKKEEYYISNVDFKS